MTIFLICAALILSIALFLRYYPPFGQRVSREKRNEFRNLPNFDRKRFVNPIHTSMRMGAADFKSLLRDYMKRNPNRKPTSPLPIKRVDPASIQQQALTRVTWFGHSAFMLEIEGKTLLFDPMLGTSPSPIPVFGNQRYSRDIPIDLDKLPPIDAVVLSHDHYDHLDFSSIQKLKKKVKHFMCRLALVVTWSAGGSQNRVLPNIIGGMHPGWTVYNSSARQRDTFQGEACLTAIRPCGRLGSLSATRAECISAGIAGMVLIFKRSVKNTDHLM